MNAIEQTSEPQTIEVTLKLPAAVLYGYIAAQHEREMASGQPWQTPEDYYAAAIAWAAYEDYQRQKRHVSGIAHFRKLFRARRSA